MAVVGITADRRWNEQADLFRRRGIEVVHGPTMRTIDLAGDAALRLVTEALVASPPAWLVATTGMGMRQWFEAADGWGLRSELLASLAQARVVARGAKASSALRQAGLEVAWRAPGESMAEVVEYLRAAGDPGEVASGTVALQLFDPDDHPATAAVRALAGRVVEVPVYRWMLPEDQRPAERLIAGVLDGSIAAVTFTSQPAVRFLFSIAERLGQREALVSCANGGRVHFVCIGAVCAEALVEAGVTTSRWPEPFRLPPMVRLTAELLGVPPQ